MTEQTTIQKKKIKKMKELQYRLVPGQFSSFHLLLLSDCTAFSCVVNTALYSHTGKKHFESNKNRSGSWKRQR